VGWCWACIDYWWYLFLFYKFPTSLPCQRCDALNFFDVNEVCERRRALVEERRRKCKGEVIFLAGE
jgi:hypothetical protein